MLRTLLPLPRLAITARQRTGLRAPPLFTGTRRQRGAVLFVALIMLLLLTLIGVTGMQVSTLQERMASGYRAGNLAFQNTEQQLILAESNVRNQVNSASPVAATVANCALAFQARNWALTALDGGATQGANVRRVDQCFGGSSRKMPQRSNENTNQFYQITAYSVDRPANPASRAAVDSVFIP
ncbi:MAG: protein PilX [Lysobacterales bacterium CG17_big_fil_post_rev_8_21_14_2_50_64_11]|nr:MAG: protein PilX [Xanthomonadales bacterium CG17_big_fil_post_rev_8_21_14_2_50_64_11]PIX60976.1 MAG: protein PilX [Xanthomonadales bacterium CG_4_10_14_3_um_filter_64_11]